MNWLHLSVPDAHAWERFWSDQNPVPGRLGESWARSAASGAQAEGPLSTPVLTQERLRVRQERHHKLITMWDQVLGDTGALFEQKDFTLLLADPQGVVLAQAAGGAFAEHAERLHLQVGSAWDEATRGTNAIGTALVEGRPVVVGGAAHLARPNHGLVCYGAPIRDPFGDVIAVLDATSFLDRADPLAGAAVVSAARAIEEVLRSTMLDGARGGVVQRLMGRLKDPAILVTADGRITLANQGAMGLGLPFSQAYASGDLLRVGASLQSVLGLTPLELDAAARGQLALPGLDVEAIETRAGRTMAWLVVLLPQAQKARRRVQSPDPFEAMVGEDPCVLDLRARARKLARSTLPILITGETGTGKELLAKAIHGVSLRNERPFVPVNCAALAPALLHSELFGYAPGAFTGASPAGKTGRIASAEGGTLFLDELAEMPLELQAMLLRFLQDGRYHPVGDTQAHQADVRVVCATCGDLDQRVADGRFRADLFYRIQGGRLALPPLRERTDLALLCEVLLYRLCDRLGRRNAPQISAAAMARIASGRWPGNIRELEMALHYALVMSEGEDLILEAHLPPIAPDPARPQLARPPTAPSLEQAEAGALRRALSQAAGNVSQAARALGVARSTVYRMMRKHGMGSPD